MANLGETSAVKDSTWIMDSGASDHMTASINLLSNVKVAPPNFTIKLPTGQKTQITHIGDIELEGGLKMLNVLYVPQFAHNLLSIHKLAKDNHCDVMFYPNKCEIVDSVTKMVKGVGLVQQGLYYLVENRKTSGELGKGKEKAPVCFTVGQSSQGQVESSLYNLWHRRLGHTSNSTTSHIPFLKTMVKAQDSVCITCPMGKLTKQPFSASKSYATLPFQLIHTDIWGPYKVETRGKFRYFLTIVDDHTRMTWVYLIKKKNDYLCTLKLFVAYAYKQFKKTVDRIRSDNALEFQDMECKRYFAEKGIHHETSCAYRPQQNGRVERKHRNILEMAL